MANESTEMMENTVEAHVNIAMAALEQYDTVDHLIFSTFMQDICLVKNSY